MSAIRYQKALIEHYAQQLPELLPEDAHEDLQTFCAIAIELMKSATPYKLREAARNVEIRHRTKELR